MIFIVMKGSPARNSRVVAVGLWQMVCISWDSHDWYAMC